ncbi:GDSL-type esterase/lipase family protein [Lachnospiraceae bacterium CLA-AA-H183]
MKKHILCIGDSNTHGLCTDPSESADHGNRYNEEERWTCLLQKALGEEYLVIEEGLSGRTCVYDDPDMDSVNLLPVLHAVLNSHEPLDLVILMLGTNDSKVKFNTDAKKITKGMQILVEEAKSVPCWGKNGPKILIVAPVPIEEGVIYPDFNEKSVETTKTLAREYAFLAVAERADFLDAGGCELTSVDHVHLTKRGHRQLAERMEAAVREIMNAETNKVVVSCECVEQSQCREEKQGAEQDGKANLDTATENILLAKEADLPRILEIYDIAKAYMRANGNPNQWNGAYPDPETLRTDIEKQRLYVYKKDGRIHGVFMLLLEEEPTYAYIEDGSWREERPYGTIHRLAGDGEVKGLFAKCVAFCEKKVKYLRADTHFDNHTMQHLLEKNGFERRGIIYLKNGDPRIAYQK